MTKLLLTDLDWTNIKLAVKLENQATGAFKTVNAVAVPARPVSSIPETVARDLALGESQCLAGPVRITVGGRYCDSSVELGGNSVVLGKSALLMLSPRV